MEPVLGGAEAGLGMWFVGVAVLPVCGDFQMRRQHSATIAHRALPACRWLALGMPWGTARSNTASEVCSRRGGASLHWGLWLGWAGGLWWWLRFYRFVEILRGGRRSTRQPQRTEPCQRRVSGQPWACHGALQAQMQPLQFAAGVVEPDLGAAAGLGRWFVGVAVLPVCGDFQKSGGEAALGNHGAQSPASV